MEGPGLVVRGEAVPFSTALRSLINNPWYSDVRFVVGQERQEIFAHRCLLACRCSFFQRLLGSEPASRVESPVVLSTVPAEAFLAVLEFLYTNSVKLYRHSVAVTFGLGPLQEYCIAFIEAHSQEALRTRGFLELSAPALLLLLRSDMLCVDEAELVRAARSWARVGAVSWAKGAKNAEGGAGYGSLASGWRWAQGWRLQAVLERPLAEVAAPVVRELRLALLAPAELSALEEQNRREPLIPVEQIVDAWKCHALRRGDEARGTPCRRRRGTVARGHHRFLDLPFQ
ncbi:BTB/POZ domain-containing protein 19 isoform X5 [Nycticebus coucang]|uniref:BTB/POZ domain-containing protein 19 isoform X5 n=1 Tax=Nycticebus coucang TaxID=9470 RepID=UPI00234CA579|nr:BTB/POZ domain-containing protein 19 isoform X5 [Nycticebus coucang]